MRQARPPWQPGQTWATFVRNHAQQLWACDFLQVTDLLFRPLFAFFIVELGSRRVVHVGVTRTPTDAWVTQQLREATPYGERPAFLVCDHDSKYGVRFTRLAAASGIEVLRTPVHRFLGSVRRECLDHLLILTEAQLRRVLRQYAAYFNGGRPHEGLGQRLPCPAQPPVAAGGAGTRVVAVPVLGGLHHEYRRVA